MFKGTITGVSPAMVGTHKVFGVPIVGSDNAISSVTAHIEHGVEFTKEPSPMKGGTRILAFIKDPDGYVIELNEPLSKK